MATINKSIPEQWFKKLISPTKNCYNLRAFVYNIFGVRLRPQQWGALRAMLDPSIRRVYLSVARQAGKTHTLGLFQTIVPIFPNQIIPNTPGTKNCHVFGPKLEQAQLSYDRFSSFVRFNPGNIFDGTITVDKADRMKFNNNVEVRAITASRNADIEGLTSHIIILEESQAISPYKVRNSIFPMGGGVPGGAKIIQVGKAGKTGSHFHKAYKDIYNPKDNPSGYRQFIFPWDKCVGLDKNYVIKLKDEDPIAFALNYELKWDASTVGMFITEDQYESCYNELTWNGIKEIMANRELPLFMGVDFAKLQDETVITVGYYDEQTETVHIVYWWALPGVDYYTQIGFIKDLYNQHNIRHILIDKSSVGEPILDFMKQAGMSVDGKSFDQSTKDKLYKFFRSKINQKKIQWPKQSSTMPVSFIKSLKKFEKQMLELEIDYKPNGLIAVNANPDDNAAHDDYPDSACLLCWAASHHIEPSCYFA